MPLDTSTPPALLAIGLCEYTLDVAALGDADQNGLICNQVLLA
jgi:hypothetical protein